MSDELWINYTTGKTLYAVRFQQDGDAFITAGDSDEAWGTGGHDAGDYAVALTETNVDNSGHYVADFDGSSNISAGTYRVCFYERAAVLAADGDPLIAQGEIYWNGASEIELGTVDSGQRIKTEVYDERTVVEGPQVTVK
jgi:hypothetical protein